MTWGRLAREVAWGRLMRVRTSKEVVKRATKEDLIAFWGSRAGVGLLVDGEQPIWKTDGAEEGWGKIENMIQ